MRRSLAVRLAHPLEYRAADSGGPDDAIAMRWTQTSTGGSTITSSNASTPAASANVSTNHGRIRQPVPAPHRVQSGSGPSARGSNGFGPWPPPADPSALGSHLLVPPNSQGSEDGDDDRHPDERIERGVLQWPRRRIGQAFGKIAEPLARRVGRGRDGIPFGEDAQGCREVVGWDERVGDEREGERSPWSTRC
jgi:hypothetical protein